MYPSTFNTFSPFPPHGHQSEQPIITHHNITASHTAHPSPPITHHTSQLLSHIPHPLLHLSKLFIHHEWFSQILFQLPFLLNCAADPNWRQQYMLMRDDTKSFSTVSQFSAVFQSTLHTHPRPTPQTIKTYSEGFDEGIHGNTDTFNNMSSGTHTCLQRGQCHFSRSI
jgi:hypothetical protein